MCTQISWSYISQILCISELNPKRFEVAKCMKWRAASVDFNLLYKEVWMPHIEERLACNDESSSREDPFAVVIKKGSETVGHVIALLFILPAVVWILSLHSYWDRTEDRVSICTRKALNCHVCWSGRAHRQNRAKKLHSAAFAHYTRPLTSKFSWLKLSQTSAHL